MSVELKLQLFFAALLALSLLGSFMLIIRTVATIEHAMNRLEQILNTEVVLARRHRISELVTQKQADDRNSGQAMRNELLLNIPFLEKLSEEKRRNAG